MKSIKRLQRVSIKNHTVGAIEDITLSDQNDKFEVKIKVREDATNRVFTLQVKEVDDLMENAFVAYSISYPHAAFIVEKI